MKEWHFNGGAILACSALKEDYRRFLCNDIAVVVIFLDGDYDLIYQRLSNRKNHFFLKKILTTQFSILEKPSQCIKISVDHSVEKICSMIIDELEF